MGFKPQGMPSAYSRASTPSTNQRKRVVDRLITIDSYNLGAQQIYGIGEDGTAILATIRPETISKNIMRAQESGNKSMMIKWEGYLIDQRMAEHLKPGQKIVLERAEDVRTVQHNGKSAKVVVADRVLNVADPHPEKVFEGLFSISTYQSKVFHVQSWERKAVNIDDAVNIERIRTRLEEGSQAYLNKQLKPHMGVQFRVVQPIGSDLVVIDTSPTFDWVPRKTDEHGQEVEPGHPLDAQKFMELLFDAQEGYGAYVNEKFPVEQFQGRFIEVCPYINYRAGQMSRYMAIPERTFDPLYRLAHTQTKLAQDDEAFVQGKNVAVLGVLQLSADQPDPVNRTYISRNIAVRLHASGPMGHVHAWVRSSDDKKTTPHEALRNVLVNKEQPGEKTSIPAYSAPAVGNNYTAPASAKATASVASSADAQSELNDRNAFEDDWDDMDDLFAEPPIADARQKLAAAKNDTFE